MFSNLPLPVPYLDRPPALIDIRVGRQLFVDDFLLEQNGLVRRFHCAKKRPLPVLQPTTPWERATLPCAAPKSGGVFFDEREGLYKMWYEAGWLHRIAYAYSADGLDWTRPRLDIDPGTNLILPGLRPDSTTVWLDADSADPSQRYKAFLRGPGGTMPGVCLVSADGVHFERATATSNLGDRSTIFYNPFRKKWVYSIRSFDGRRNRHYRECDDFLQGAVWGRDEELGWLRPDCLDLPEEAIGFEPQLYNLDAVGYESLLLGLYQNHLGPENDACERGGFPKLTELQLAFSRDGFHFSRPVRDQAFLPAARQAGAWDRGYVQSVGGVCLIHGDELWFYYIGFAGDESNRNTDWTLNGMYSGACTGLATLRRDGFASLEAAQRPAALLTRPLVCESRPFLYVNAAVAPEGWLRAEVQDAQGHPLEGYGLDDCLPLQGDGCQLRLSWKGHPELRLGETPFRLRFTLKNASLYAFWLGDEGGESHGAHAAGRTR